MLLKIFLITLLWLVHQSFEENVSPRDIDPKRYNPVTDTLEEVERQSKSKQLYCKEVL